MSGLCWTVIKVDAETEYLPRQFARLIGISESTLAKQRMPGDGPEFVKIGRAVRYSREAGLAWMASHRRRSTSDEARPRNRRRRTMTSAIEANGEPA
jgi:predicted DNA-binding transcriptional regulator AlpA